MGTGHVYDGVDEVKAYYATSRAVFPDQRNEIRALHHADGAVVVEFDLLGTHTGSLAGEEPTGRAFRCPMVAIFIFEGEGIVCERVYFDSGTIYRQLGVG
jgi:predicted ester cyclase